MFCSTYVFNLFDYLYLESILVLVEDIVVLSYTHETFKFGISLTLIGWTRSSYIRTIHLGLIVLALA